MNDTDPKIAEKIIEMFESKTPQERLDMTWSMYHTSKRLVTWAILQEKPNISKKELKKELFLKFYGDDFDEKQKEKILNYLDQQ